MACPSVFPPGSLTADGAAASWVGANVCIDAAKGAPACFPNRTALAEAGEEVPQWFLKRLERNPWLNETTPCPVDDGDCFNKFYDCKSMYENTFKDQYDTWEMIMFFMWMIAAAYAAHHLALAIDPTRHREYALLVSVLASLGRFEEATKAFDEKVNRRLPVATGHEHQLRAVAGAAGAQNPHTPYDDDLGAGARTNEVLLAPPPFPLELVNAGVIVDGSRQWERPEQQLLWRWLKMGCKNTFS